jgi:S-adenosyl-L-methionine hydrolase (adenosine-forming)
MARPFISFLTDFGADGAAAICRGVMLSIAPDAQILDISHAVRKFAIRDGAYLLWMAVPWLPIGTHVAVVDPGVGTARRPIAIRAARGDMLIGPDNGLLMPAAEALGGIEAVRVLENADWMLPRQSATFHGRDVFTPMAAHLAIGRAFEDVGPEVDPTSLIQLRSADPVVREGALEVEALYVDSFGNVRLGARRADLDRTLGSPVEGTRLRLLLEPPEARAGNAPASPAIEAATWARTFGKLPLGATLVYEDSSGQLALGRNQADAAAALGLEPGWRIRIERA